eukprot:SAG31_NODE_555_length_14169_cov_19.798721_4_plen_54_part_00
MGAHLEQVERSQARSSSTLRFLRMHVPRVWKYPNETRAVAVLPARFGVTLHER